MTTTNISKKDMDLSLVIVRESHKREKNTTLTFFTIFLQFLQHT